ncbi:MAG: copper resistance protein CopC [Caldilineaceae bacterium]|nr:copper resistance protein CopC [Caldilineaceae bacterium]
MAALRTLIRCLLATSVVLLSGISPGRLLAHADYDRSEPPAGALVAAAPTQVRIHFTQEIFRRQGVNGIQVYAANGERVDLDDAAIDDDNRRLMAVSLKPDLADGEYVVRWFALSAEDGHEGEGEFNFTVAATPITDAQPLTTTDLLTNAVTPSQEVTDEATATMTAVATVPSTPTPAAANEATSTASDSAQSSPSSGFPCPGGASPLGLVLGLAWFGRRRMMRLGG